jgi:mRNA interferase MazF
MTPPTTNYRRGDVVLVPFPFTDLSTTKQRPALVVSPDAWNATQPDVMLVAITSQMTVAPGPQDLVLTAPDIAAAGLPKPSRVRTTKLFTMHSGLLKRTLGRLPDATTNTVLIQLRTFLS